MERHSSRATHAAQPKAAAAPAQPAAAARSTAHAAASKLDTPTLSSKILVIALIFASIAVTVTLLASALASLGGETLVKDDKYQAVFLDNGQVYFGKMAAADAGFVRLTDIYYLQVDQQIQPGQVNEDGTPVTQSSISLAKLGNELHGPEDEMFINGDKIVFWENLKTDGQVTEAIERYLEDGDTTTQQQTPVEGTQPAGTEQVDDTPADSDAGSELETTQ